MSPKRTLVSLASLLAVTLAACLGGSGSSGFDVTAAFENERIDQAVSSRECVSLEGTLVCPTDRETGAAPGTPDALPNVDSGFGEGSSPACVPAGADTCTLPVSFAPTGLPADAVYAVAVRGVAPPGGWLLIAAEDVYIRPGPVIEAVVPLPAETQVAQVALLAFLDGDRAPRSGPLDTLTGTGAADIFVTQPFSVAPAGP